jgi:hypothetical protein
VGGSRESAVQRPTPGELARQCEQTNFFQVTRFRTIQGYPVIAGFMHVDVNEAESEGWCEKVARAIAECASAAGMYAAASGPASIASGAFGILSVLSVGGGARTGLWLGGREIRRRYR